METFGIIEIANYRRRDTTRAVSPQLEAYAFSLGRISQKGDPKKISTVGLYTWSLDRASGNLSAAGFGAIASIILGSPLSAQPHRR
jgi:hypothetical protein